MPKSRGGLMTLVAGLPPATHNRAITALKQRFPEWEIRGLAATPKDGGLLYPKAAREELARQATDFVVQRRARVPNPPTPRSIILLFVPAPDSEKLLEMFDFAVMPQPLVTLNLWDERGAQLRQTWSAVEEALNASLAASGPARMALNLVTERLNRQADNEGLLLPPRTFTTNEGFLADEFVAFRSGVRPWEDRLTHLGPAELTHQDIARIPEEKTRRSFVDARRIAYLIAHPSAYHAEPRTKGEDADLVTLLNQLRTLYRFGAGLPPGLHHDAIYRDGSAFKRTPFQCSQAGHREVSAAYVNIYPDDFLRIPKK
jgi:hypothetical protein